jgi:hypothetical protein
MYVMTATHRSQSVLPSDSDSDVDEELLHVPVGAVNSRRKSTHVTVLQTHTTARNTDLHVVDMDEYEAGTGNGDDLNDDKVRSLCGNKLFDTDSEGGKGKSDARAAVSVHVASKPNRCGLNSLAVSSASEDDDVINCSIVTVRF